MIDTYIPVLAIILMASGMIVSILILSICLGPKRHSEVKDQPFECGTVGSGTLGGRHSVKFYLIAMTFIVFDVEIVFLYPWAITVKELGWTSFLAALPFIAILSIGLLYEWRKGLLDI